MLLESLCYNESEIDVLLWIGVPFESPMSNSMRNTGRVLDARGTYSTTTAWETGAYTIIRSAVPHEVVLELTGQARAPIGSKASSRNRANGAEYVAY